MATAEDLVSQSQQATTSEQLDAIAALSSDQAVQQAVQSRRDQITPQRATAARGQAEAAALGANATTDPDKRQYFDVLNADGSVARTVNAWGEEKGSAEDKKRSGKDSSAA